MRWKLIITDAYFHHPISYWVDSYLEGLEVADALLHVFWLLDGSPQTAKLVNEDRTIDVYRAIAPKYSQPRMKFYFQKDVYSTASGQSN